MKKISADTDFEFIEKVKKGDTSAFRYLVDKYKDVSFSLAISIIRNEYDAEDSLQEAFIKAFRAIRKFRYQSSFSTWLYKIVVNTCYTNLKKLQKQQKYVELGSIKEFEHYNEENGLEALISSERSQIINKILDTLKPEEALLLRLYYLSELEILEIMDVTGFKESKTKVTLYRARKNLLKEFQNIFGNKVMPI